MVHVLRQYLKKFNSDSGELNKEIHHYLKTEVCDQDIDLLVCWSENKENYPNLFAASQELLSIMPSSEPVERVFSKCQ